MKPTIQSLLLAVICLLPPAPVFAATFTVQNLSDSGAGSLRNAIALAATNPGPDVIQFDPKLEGTIKLTSGELLIKSSVTINGPSTKELTVSGNDASRVFHIVGGADQAGAIKVAISDLAVVRGRAESGGGISHEGFAELTLQRMKVSDNRADLQGGGLFTSGAGARLNVTQSFITNNQVVGLAGFMVFSGGIRVVGGATASISQTSITGNRVVGPPEAGLAVGGGLSNSLESTMTLTECFICNNQSIGGPGGGEGDGGAIVNGRGSTLNVRRCVLSGNEARGSDGQGLAVGGAIFNAFPSTAFVSDSLLSENRAIAGSGGFNDVDDLSTGVAFGGAISNGNYLEVTRCKFIGNQAIGGSNATHLAPLTADVGCAHGGAIDGSAGVAVVVRDSSFRDNKAIGGNGNTGSGPICFSGEATGGAIENAYDLALFGEPSASPLLTVTGCLFVGNEAQGGKDNSGAGGVVFAGHGLGGVIANYLGATTEITASPMIGNRASGGKTARGAGGAIFNALGGYQPPGGSAIAPSSVKITRSNLEKNVAEGGSGKPGGDGLGGGAYNDDTSALTLRQSSVVENHAKKKDGGKGIGGGIYDLGTLDLDAATVVSRNHASTSNDNIFDD